MATQFLSPMKLFYDVKRVLKRWAGKDQQNIRRSKILASISLFCGNKFYTQVFIFITVKCNGLFPSESWATTQSVSNKANLLSEYSSTASIKALAAICHRLLPWWQALLSQLPRGSMLCCTRQQHGDISSSQMQKRSKLGVKGSLRRGEQSVPTGHSCYLSNLSLILPSLSFTK